MGETGFRGRPAEARPASLVAGRYLRASAGRCIGAACFPNASPAISGEAWPARKVRDCGLILGIGRQTALMLEKK
jgi:hypothetical protein